jgi:prepilin-type N-terminal cleavage/methylation domain-containing protein
VVDSTEARPENDGGFTIIEVIVAMMVFAVIALGVGFSTITTIRMTSDARSREVAANLAAGEIDAVRAAPDPFTVYNATRTVAIDGTRYTVARSAGWVSTTGTSSGCGAGTGNLQYKRVNVTVSWPGQLTTGSAAHADTVLAPNSRLNDPSFGSVLISVLNAAGTGSAGVSVSLTPATGGAAIPSTDADGCSYAFKVPAGTYTVRITRAASLDAAQQSAPTATVAVKKGEAVAASFQYDYAARLTPRYAAGANPAPLLPADLDVSYFAGTGLFRVHGLPSQVSLYPYGSGYTAVAGVATNAAGTVTCLSVDPGSWIAGTVAGKALAAGARSAVAPSTPAGTAGIDVRMGQLTVTSAAATVAVRVVSAVAPAGTGDPGCANAQTYTYAGLPATGAVTLAVPFGSWTVEEQGAGGAWTQIPAARLAVPSNAAGPTVTTPVVTLDPRPLA